jgi:hypothetical protein
MVVAFGVIVAVHDQIRVFLALEAGPGASPDVPDR